ncbi:Cu(I)/Ag(I) efflux system membrane fusion protein [Spirosoma oryzae]|uniref:Cu(I)/Ag(I) efflux system membrane fusion protein n=2 Tax=Spirosoma oryzae TaxID=1469603 RepID=A0A2T0SNJ8_9BACT|nr:Cu(I)/Ag(I) efflux system membrane fusion protein [Spirosoma oryzae]
MLLLNASCESGGSTSSKGTDSTGRHSAQIAGADDPSSHNHSLNEEGSATELHSAYTCPMHPQIVQSSPGTCPICSMDLVPVAKTGEKAAEIVLSASQMQLANVTVQPVSSGSIGNSTVLNARLAADQQQTDVISSRVAGRIERLFVKETGQPIRKGQVLYEIYSEPLLTQQQEYLIALQQEAELGTTEKRYSQFRQAAEQKLRLYGMTADQIAGLVRTKKVLPRIPFVAPSGGTVTEIVVSEGQYVGEGALLYRLANLSQLWVEAELYAGEAKYVKVGDRLPVQVVGYEGGQAQTARIAFINPEYRAGSQVLVMRAVMPNPGGRYQPGQQARVLLRHGVQRGLTLPVDAVVRAGQGAVVFVQTGRQSENRPTDGTAFQPRLVQTGTETDQRVAIMKGLNGDETIAMSGAYLLYSELILKKGVNPFTQKPDDEGVKSTPNGETNPTPVPAVTNKATSASRIPNIHTAPDGFKKQLTGVYEASLKLTESLVSSDANRSKVAAGGVEKALSGVDMMLLSGQAHTDWMKYLNAMNAALKVIRSTGDLEQQRTAYAQFEDGLYRSVKAFDITDKPIYRQYCPMALNSNGSYWLSDEKPIRNPYFGDQMLTCGETKEVLR